MKNRTGQDPFSSDSLYSTRVENSQRPWFTGYKENLKYYVPYLSAFILLFYLFDLHSNHMKSSRCIYLSFVGDNQVS